MANIRIIIAQPGFAPIMPCGDVNRIGVTSADANSI